MAAIMSVLVLACCLTLAVSYSTSGNKILDPNGNQIVLRGVARPSLEWNPVGEHLSFTDYQLMKHWGSNVVRLGLNQCFWLSTCNGYDPNYVNTVNQQVMWIKSLGMGVIIDLHWTNKGVTSNSCGQQTMPDSSSITFWNAVATQYKNDPWVMFELYNEPHDVSWSVWRNGGDAGGFTTPGFQALYDAVRATGANNVVIIGGLNYAFDLSGVGSNPITGSNIVYNTHPYDFPGKQPGDWNSAFGYLTPNYPVIATEFGNFDCTTAYIDSWIAYADANFISWTAWGWYVGGCGFPSLITDWTGTPAVNGAPVINSLARNFTFASATTATGAPATVAPTASPTTKPIEAGTTGLPTSSNTVPVYTDNAVSAPFRDWSWAPVRNPADYSRAFAGSSSYSFQPSEYGAVYFYVGAGISTTLHKSIDFQIYVGAGGQKMNFNIISHNGNSNIVGPNEKVDSYCASNPIAANTWVKCSVPLANFPTGTYDAFWIQDNSGTSQATVYLDNIMLIGK